MPQHFWFALTGALGAVYLSVLNSIGSSADPIFPETREITSSTIAIQPQAPRMVAIRTPSLPDVVDSVTNANRFFISQYRSIFNPRATNANANCGPACLAMAMKRFFLGSDAVSQTDPEKLIRLARIAMTGNGDDDVTTDNDDVISGAKGLGLRAERAWNLDAVDAALDGGGFAIVSGSPSVPGAFGKRLRYHHCRGGHFIAVAGRSGDNYLMCDPESPNGTNEITRAELSAFMSYWSTKHPSLHGAVALWPSENRLSDSAVAQLERLTM